MSRRRSSVRILQMFLVKPTFIVFGHVNKVCQSLFFNHRDCFKMSGNNLQVEDERMINKAEMMLSQHLVHHMINPWKLIGYTCWNYEVIAPINIKGEGSVSAIFGPIQDLIMLVIFCSNTPYNCKIMCFRLIFQVFPILGLKVKKNPKNRWFLEKFNISYIPTFKFKYLASYR